MKNPCERDCPDRSPVCHCECGRYAEYAAWCEEKRQERAAYARSKPRSRGKEKALRAKLAREKQGRKQ